MENPHLNESCHSSSSSSSNVESGRRSVLAAAEHATSTVSSLRSATTTQTGLTETAMLRHQQPALMLVPCAVLAAVLVALMLLRRSK
jgi:hypothetical protein